MGVDSILKLLIWCFGQFQDWIWSKLSLAKFVWPQPSLEKSGRSRRNNPPRWLCGGTGPVCGLKDLDMILLPKKHVLSSPLCMSIFNPLKPPLFSCSTCCRPFKMVEFSRGHGFNMVQLKQNVSSTHKKTCEYSHWNTIDTSHQHWNHW